MNIIKITPESIFEWDKLVKKAEERTKKDMESCTKNIKELIEIAKKISNNNIKRQEPLYHHQPKFTTCWINRIKRFFNGYY